MFKLGQNISNKLLSGILVSLLCFAVAQINSVTVHIKSRCSCGKRESNDESLSRSVLEGCIFVSLGKPRVESEGFRGNGIESCGGSDPEMNEDPRLPLLE
jgi:hypothetical protein